MTNQTTDLGNNESIGQGVFPQSDGTFLATTFSASKSFKTIVGAEKWLARRNIVRGQAIIAATIARKRGLQSCPPACRQAGHIGKAGCVEAQ